MQASGLKTLLCIAQLLDYDQLAQISGKVYDRPLIAKAHSYDFVIPNYIGGDDDLLATMSSSKAINNAVRVHPPAARRRVSWPTSSRR